MFGLFPSKRDKYLIDNANRFATYLQQNCLKQTLDCLSRSASGLEVLRKLSTGGNKFGEAGTLNIISAAIFAFRCTEEVSYLRNKSFGDKAISSFVSCLAAREAEFFEKSKLKVDILNVLTMQNALRVRRLASDDALEYHFSVYISYILEIFQLELTDDESKKIFDNLFRAMISFPTVIKIIGQEGIS